MNSLRHDTMTHESEKVNSPYRAIEKKIFDMHQYLQNNCSDSFDKENSIQSTNQQYLPASINQAFTFSTWSSSAESIENKLSSFDHKSPVVSMRDVYDQTSSEPNLQQGLENSEAESLAEIHEEIFNMKSIVRNSGMKFCKEDGREIEVEKILHQFEDALVSTQEIGEMIALHDIKNGHPNGGRCA